MTFTKLGAFALTTALVSTSAFADGHIDRTGWPESFTLGTASQGGTYFAYGSGWANLVADELGLSGGAEVTGGPMQNMALVHTGEAQFGMTTMGPASDSLALLGDAPGVRSLPGVSRPRMTRSAALRNSRTLPGQGRAASSASVPGRTAGTGRLWRVDARLSRIW